MTSRDFGKGTTELEAAVEAADYARSIAGWAFGPSLRNPTAIHEAEPFRRCLGFRHGGSSRQHSADRRVPREDLAQRER